MAEENQRKTYSTNEIFMADVIKVDDFIKLKIGEEEKTIIDGPVLKDRKHNLFVKNGDFYTRIVSGRDYKVLQYPCEEGEIGLQEHTVKPLKEKLKLAFDENKIENLDLNLKDVKKLQEIMAKIHVEDEASLASRFMDFLDYYEGDEREF